MKRCLLTAVLTLWASAAHGQTDFHQLVGSCLPGVDEQTVVGIVKTESSFRPYVLSLNYPGMSARKLGLPPGIVYLKEQPSGPEEARRWGKILLDAGFTLSVGLMQVSTESAGMRLEELLDPCTNLKAGWAIFEQKYDQAVSRYGRGRRALLAALSLYNGSPHDAHNSYARTVLRNAR